MKFVADNCGYYTRMCHFPNIIVGTALEGKLETEGSK